MNPNILKTQAKFFLDDNRLIYQDAFEEELAMTSDPEDWEEDQSIDYSLDSSYETCDAQVDEVQEETDRVAEASEQSMRQLERPLETEVLEEADIMSMLSEEDINDIRSALIAKTPIDNFVESLNEAISGVPTEDETDEIKQLRSLLLAPANAFYNVAEGIISIPDTVVSVSQMVSEADTSQLSQAGEIVYNVFISHMSAMQKSTFAIQFSGELVVGAGLIGAINKIAKSAKMVKILARIGDVTKKVVRAVPKKVSGVVNKVATGKTKKVIGQVADTAEAMAPTAKRVGQLGVKVGDKTLTKTAKLATRPSVGRVVASEEEENADVQIATDYDKESDIEENMG